MILRTPNADVFHSTIRMIEGGDKRNSTNLAAAPEDLGDNVAFLAKRFGGAASEVGVWYPIPMSSAVIVPLLNGIEWEFERVPGSDANWPIMGMRTNADASLLAIHSLWFQLASFLPPAGMLREVTLNVIGTGGTLPAHKPQLSLYGANVETHEIVKFVGPGEEIECEDESLTAEAYNAAHDVGITYLSGGQYKRIDLSVYRSLMLRIDSEYGLNAANHTYYYNLHCIVASKEWTVES